MKKGLLILLAMIGLMIFFVAKNIKSTVKNKKANPGGTNGIVAPTVNPTSSSTIKPIVEAAKTQNIQDPIHKPKSREDEEEEEYEDEEVTPSHHNQAKHSESLPPSFSHNIGETANIKAPPPPVAQTATPAPVRTHYVQPTPPPIDNLAPMVVKP